jgi:hypothetical protein
MNDETRRERIVLETERHRIVGDVTLPSEGYRSRLSDMLNRESLTFVPLANAIITGINGNKDVTKMRFIAVARDHIQIAYEEALNADAGNDLLDEAIPIDTDDDLGADDDGGDAESDEDEGEASNGADRLV